MAVEPVDVLLRVIGALERLGILYLIGGSFASSLYGRSRSTLDADLVAAIKPEQVLTLVQELESEFYVSEEAVMRAVQAKRHFNLIHADTSFKVDVFVAKGDGFTAKQLERRQLRNMRADVQQRAYFATAEDTILAKLEWYRRGNEVSDQQWRDITGVIKVQSGRLDLEYLRHWARELNVSDLLEEALTDF